MNHRPILLLVLMACSLHGQQQTRNVDFRNFSFPFRQTSMGSIPVQMSQMDINESSKVALVNGYHHFNNEHLERGPSLILSEVYYSEITMGEHLDALVVLSYETGGSAHWNYVYIYSLGAGGPKLLSWFETGGGSDYGLYRVYVTYGGFDLDLLNPDERRGLCCSAGFVRSKFVWREEKFVVGGPLEYGQVEEHPTTRPK